MVGLWKTLELQSWKKAGHRSGSWPSRDRRAQPALRRWSSQLEASQTIQPPGLVRANFDEWDGESNGRWHYVLLSPSCQRLTLFRFNVKSRAQRVLVKHFHRVERVFGEILSDQRQLAQNVVRHRDDMTADGVGVEDIQQFA